MTDNRVSISTIQTMVKGWQSLRANGKATFQVAVFTMFLPQVAEDFVFGRLAGQTTKELWDIFDGSPKGTPYTVWLETAVPYFSNYLISFVFVWFLAVLGYLSLVQIFVEFERSRKPLRAWPALKAGLSSVIPKGLIMSVAVALFSTLGQTVMPFFIFLSSLCLMAPVLAAVEGTGGFRSVANSLTLGYAKHSQQASRWGVFVCLAGVVAVIYFGVFLALYAGQHWLLLDAVTGFPRRIWSEGIFGLPYSAAFLVNRVLEVGIYAALVAILPPTTVGLYFELKRRISVQV